MSWCSHPEAKAIVARVQAVEGLPPAVAQDLRRLAWLVSGDTGSSSEAIFKHMTGAATSPAELSAFAQSFAEAGHPAPWFHLLGAVPEMALWPGRRYLDLLVAVRRCLPDALVTCDSVRLRALVGRNKGRGDKPRPLTAAQDAARAQGLTGARAVKRAAVQAVYSAERARLEVEGAALLKRIAGLEDERARAPRQFDFGFTFTPTRRSA